MRCGRGDNKPALFYYPCHARVYQGEPHLHIPRITVSRFPVFSITHRIFYVGCLFLL